MLIARLRGRSRCSPVENFHLNGDDQCESIDWKIVPREGFNPTSIAPSPQVEDPPAVGVVGAQSLWWQGT